MAGLSKSKLSDNFWDLAVSTLQKAISLINGKVENSDVKRIVNSEYYKFGTGESTIDVNFSKRSCIWLVFSYNRLSSILIKY